MIKFVLQVHGCLFAVLLICCGAKVTFAKEGHHHHAPTGGVSAIDVYAEGDSLHLLVAKSVGDGGKSSELWYHPSIDGGKTWQEAVRVDEGLPSAFSPRRGMDPQIASSNGRLIAVWMIAGTDRWGSGPMAVAVSEDKGQTWKSGTNPSDSGLTTGHGFIDIAADESGTFHVVWLDSRDGSQGLRYSQSSDGGTTWKANLTLQSGTCECCSNRIVAGPGGKLAVLFRGKDPRDMKVVLSHDNGIQWEAPATAGAFDWQFDGCPHVGGGLALTSDGKEGKVHTLVWTGASSATGVHYAKVSPKSEKAPSPKLMSTSLGNYPDLCSHPNGGLAAVWREAEDEDGTLFYALSSDVGDSWTERKSVHETEGSATHPILVATVDGFRVFWTETAKAGSSVWKSAALKME